MNTDYINRKFYGSARPLTDTEQNRYSTLLNQYSGIESMQVTSEWIYIEYNRYLTSENLISELLTDNGFLIRESQKTGFLRKSIRVLASSNEKSYGSNKLDCCNIKNNT